MEIGGINVAAVTPYRSEDREIDLGAALEMVDFYCQAGLKGIALLGSTGEFLHFRLEDRMKLLRMVVRRSRVPVIAGVSDTSLNGAIQLACSAMDAGAAALLLMPPYFFCYAQEEIEEFFLRFREEVGASVPVILYNIPFFTNPIAVETALRLLETGRFGGIKDSSGEFVYFERLKELRQRVPFRILVGNDVIFTRARKAGADGGVSGCASMAPELLLALDYAIARRDQGRIEHLESRLSELIGWLDRFPVPVGIKEAMKMRKLTVGPPAVPLSPAKERLLAEYREWFGGWLPLVKKEAEAT